MLTRDRIRVGTAASPRWFDLDHETLDAYIRHLKEAGAESAELVLHHGEADLPVARVHILEPDWVVVAERFHRAGMRLNLHASLAPEFSLRRWFIDPYGLLEAFQPLLDGAGRIAAAQGDAVMVLHAASSRDRSPCENRDATEAFLLAVLGRSVPSLRFAIELRHVGTGEVERSDTGRGGLVDLVDRVASERVGICWDTAHDWENRDREAGWTPIPGPAFMERVIHVHAHDANPAGTVHYPLTLRRLPWSEQFAALRDRGYRGEVTLELRYRFAVATGEPWTVAAESIRLARGAIDPADA